MNTLWPLVYSPEIATALASWGLAALVEAGIWHRLFVARTGGAKFASILGWMTVVQAISSPLSFGTAMALYGVLLGVFPLPSYIDAVNQSRSIQWNPIGAVIGFLVVPALLETLLWWDALSRNPVRMTKRGIRLETGLPRGLVAGWTLAANTVSFLVGILLTLSSAWLSVQVVLGWFLTIPLIFLLIWFLVTSFRRNAHTRREWQEESEKPARVPTVAVPKRLPAALSKRNAFFALEAFAVGLFLVALLVVSPALASPPETPNTGPQQYQAVIDGNGRLHLVWEDAVELANGSIQLTIKHRNYDGETWSQEGLVSSPRIASWIEFWVTEDVGLYRSYLNSPVTLACNGGNELAAGWVQRIRDDTGSACYCIFNGTEWQESQNLPNSNATDTFKLQYGNDGALYATWLEFNASEPYSSYYWWLYCWKIGEGTPPSAILERNNSQAVPRHPALFSNKEGDLCVLWEQVSPTNASSYLYFSSSQNGTWSERLLVSDPAIGLGDWDAVMTPDDSLHLVWVGWENYEAVMYYQSFHDSVWEQKIPLSEQFGGIWETQIASDSDGDLQAMWLGYHNIYPWTYYYYTCRRLHSTWQNCLPIANLGRHDGESTHLAMESATRSHIIQRQPVDSSAQLVHYQLDSEFAQPIAILAETTSTLLARLKPYIIVKGLVPIIGALVFLPITVYVLRRCVARIWT